MPSFAPSGFPVNYSTVHKPSVESSRGIVASQVYDASAAGVAILEAGGNAVDAAVATAFALAVVEPWNSGLGGIGFALVHGVNDVRASSVHFGPVAPMAVTPELFPLTGRPGNDIFPWPQVENDANAHGPLSFCLPTAVAGYGTMLEHFGTMQLKDVMQPAIELARRGLALDWFTTLMLAQAAPLLRKYETSSTTFLRDGLPPVPPYQGVPGFMNLGNLQGTLERIARDGWRDFYRGELASDIVKDIKAVGGVISIEEMASYEPEIRPCLSVDWKGSQIQLLSGMTAGPTLADTLARLKADGLPEERGIPSGEWYKTLAKSMKAAYAKRLDSVGDDEPKGLGCTTHISVTDASGNMVSMTSTLLSSMGSRVTLPSTGFVMNNAVLWFDPRPGSANSVGPRKRPLTNMCPAIVAKDGKPVIVAGAAGGRRIMASVAQLVLFVHDLGMDVEEAGHYPRIDVSGPDLVSIDRRLGSSVAEALSELGATELVDHDVLPINFARPSIIDGREPGRAVGISDSRSPWSAALAPTARRRAGK